jgi:hypothetical protein
MPGQVLKLGHDGFLQHSFQFIIHYNRIFLLYIESNAVRAIARAVSRLLPTAAARVRFYVR